MTESGADFSFSSLTPDVIVTALESVNCAPISGLLALNSYENRVYQFKADDERRYVAKFYRPQRWTREQILEEHAFTAELDDAEVPVVAPRIWQQQTLHEYQGYWFCIFPSIGGRAFEADSLDQLERLGRQIGRLHAVAKTGKFKQRPELNYQSFVTESVATLKASELIPDSLRTAFFAILEPLAEALKGTDLSRYKQQRLHGDCHLGNILQYDEKLTFVDFDDARTGPAIQDLWMMLSGDRQQQWLQLDTLVAGYEEFCEFDAAEVALVEPLRGFRIIHYMAWLARRWDDSAFRRAFPWFEEQRYWEQQILTLKEQLAALAEEPLKLMP
ncbi:Ser/Thr protein kinase RdoA involved in Cpx stress response, MazF antagonist [Pseudidiomarina planktonica]|uniref:Stress response kinase A n=1 Tax=Pseudidiomarina planktonica TaxID=1323738 RepID=A0A1Y6E4Y4_9GAMM|nr:serine/threonine protein kinase [Pseudidiomarina planktonica]RUO66476.1 serine/threonine protein kinase [Pseudidiomarina planktonica]SMQ57827.1 Ser/Thr protein kinase RdoA involved in Cpx stress response, MazF antagonist [Pseudidiomarina planktonica]